MIRRSTKGIKDIVKDVENVAEEMIKDVEEVVL